MLGRVAFVPLYPALSPAIGPRAGIATRFTPILPSGVVYFPARRIEPRAIVPPARRRAPQRTLGQTSRRVTRGTSGLVARS